VHVIVNSGRTKSVEKSGKIGFVKRGTFALRRKKIERQRNLIELVTKFYCAKIIKIISFD